MLHEQWRMRLAKKKRRRKRSGHVVRCCRSRWRCCGGRWRLLLFFPVSTLLFLSIYVPPLLCFFFCFLRWCYCRWRCFWEVLLAAMEVVKPMAKVFAAGGRDGEREREERFGWQQKGRGEASFLLILDPKISSSGP